MNKKYFVMYLNCVFLHDGGLGTGKPALDFPEGRPGFLPRKCTTQLLSDRESLHFCVFFV